MSNWCKNKVRVKEKKLSLLEQSNNWFFLNLSVIIENVFYTAISIGAVVYSLHLTEDASFNLVQFMCFVGILSITMIPKRENKNNFRYLPFILAIIVIRCM